MTPGSRERVFDEGGDPVGLGLELGRGGEATVYALGDGRAAKLYHRAAPEQAEKLRLMIADPPHDPTREAGHLSIAWPEALLFDAAGGVAGFVMPFVDPARTLPLHQLSNPKTRRQRAPDLTWAYSVRIARNLCTVVAALHRKGYVIGDLNESNVLVTSRALVTLVDCDSVQVGRGREAYRCPVGKGEYTPPELQGRPFRDLTRTPAHDAFALAVLIYMLLLEGVHPFSGRYRGEGDPPTTLQTIAERKSPLFGHPRLGPVPSAPPLHILPSPLRRLGRRALLSRWRRPSAERWQRALSRLERDLVPCSVNPNHVYSAHLRGCPWCLRLQTTGLEAFPNREKSAHQVAPHVRPSLPRFRASPWGWLKRFFVLANLLLFLCGAGAYGLSQLGRRLMGAFEGYVPPLLGVGLFALLTATLLTFAYRRTRASPLLYLRLQRLEVSGRVLLGGAALALALSVFLDLLTGWGSVLEGDWALVPSLWLFGAFIVWRSLRRSL